MGFPGHPHVLIHDTLICSQWVYLLIKFGTAQAIFFDRIGISHFSANTHLR